MADQTVTITVVRQASTPAPPFGSSDVNGKRVLSANWVDLRAYGQDDRNSQIVFKLKPTTKMSKLMSSYGERMVVMPPTTD